MSARVRAAAPESKSPRTVTSVASTSTAEGAPASRTGTSGWRSELSYRPLVVLLALGVALRGWAMFAYFPAVMMSFDTPRFARVDPQELFGDFWMPAGYPALLKTLHVFSDAVWVSIGVQHLLGLLVAVALYLTCRRLGVPRALACVPAGVVLLSGDHVYLEHILLADTLLIALTAFGLAAAVRGLVPRPDGRWLAASGSLLAAAALTRSPGLVLVLVLLAGVALAAPGRFGQRLVPLAAAAAGAGVVFVLYGIAFQVAGGPYAGMADMRGWNLYSRVAPFADCRRFSPPAGTARLCESRPAAARPGPFGYVWDAASISRRSFPLEPDGGAPLEAFAREAILAQPGDYGSAVLTDLARYAFPEVGPDRGFSGQGRDLVSFRFRDPEVERLVTVALDRRYEGVRLSVRGQQALGSYQDTMRVGGVLLVSMVALALAGLVLARGRLRTGVLLFGLAGLGLYVVPTLTVSYDFRYGIPPGTFVVVAATLTAAELLVRRRPPGPAAREAT